MGVLVLVTPLLAEYGSSSWSWIGGPIAALILSALGKTTGDLGAWRTLATPTRLSLGRDRRSPLRDSYERLERLEAAAGRERAARRA